MPKGGCGCKGGKTRKMRVVKKHKLVKKKRSKTSKMRKSLKKIRMKKMKGGSFLLDNNVRLPTHFATIGGVQIAKSFMENEPIQDNSPYVTNVSTTDMV
jgi:hypothetical protein